MSEETVKQFASAAAPVIRHLERSTGRGANSLAIAMGTYNSRRTTQRLLFLAELYGYMYRTNGGKYTRWALAPTFPLPIPLSAPRLRQLQLPLPYAA
jgi:hypothetical protein